MMSGSARATIRRGSPTTKKMPPPMPLSGTAVQGLEASSLEFPMLPLTGQRTDEGTPCPSTSMSISTHRATKRTCCSRSQPAGAVPPNEHHE
eukprot:NODE_4799_length_640_cov_188.227350.p3 GENE.NODE_4799_length_640_cov_188.227350~~NODE_4799_length_640_cov_188.227350.p3  ORF type:complete len:92 (+),score=15.98 NODE_4799_length_640_cov_188.227350:229-504(+)